MDTRNTFHDKKIKEEKKPEVEKIKIEEKEKEKTE